MSSSLPPWKQCAVCKTSARFQTPAEFINHLRQEHCRREGGSYVCHYGSNGVCSSLPLEGVSDVDYDRHVKTRHLVDATGVNRSSEVRFSQSPSPCSSRGLSPPREHRWTLYDVSQNLPALLNDPSRSRQRDLFTKTWGESFVPCSVADSPLLPPVSQSDFHSYSKMVEKRQSQADGERRVADKTRNSEQPVSSLNSSVSSDTRSDLSVVPEVWFDPKFDLRHQETFRLICPDGVVCGRSRETLEAATQQLETARTAARGRQKRVVTSRAQLPEFSLIDRTTHDQLTYYLDLVEMCIASQIADKSEAFFDAMSSHDVLMKQLDGATRSVKTLRRSLSTLRQSQLLKIASVLRGQQLRVNGSKLLQLLRLMRTLRQTQPTIQMLLSSTDYVGALDLIGTSQEVLQQELAGVQAFRHFSGQLNEMRALIDKMVTTEYVRLVAADLNRPLDDTSSAEQDVLVPVVFGMLRLCNVSLVDLYRDECYTATRAVVKQLAIESLAEAEGSVSSAPSVDADEKQDEHDSNSLQLPLAENLSSDQWLFLLRRVCQSLVTLLTRIKMFCNLLRSVLGSDGPSGTETPDETGRGDGVSSLPPPLSPLPHSVAPSISGHLHDSVLTSEQHSRLLDAVVQLPARLTEYMHEQFSSLLQMFMRSVGGGDVPQFLLLADIVEQFVVSCRSVSGKLCHLLYSTLQTQASRFIQQFHAERRQKLTLLLDTERWRQTDVPAQFQAMIDNVIATGEPGLLPVDISEPSTASVTGTRTRLRVLDTEYSVVGTILMLLRLVFEYCDCAKRLVSITPEILIKLTDLLRVYNSISCRLVVGGGAVQQPSATLKTISLRNLALSGRSLQLILRLSPYITKLFQRLLPEGHSSMKHLNQVCADYGAHVAEIDAKLVNIVTDVCDNQLNKWQAKPPIPSQCFRAICLAIGKLHESVNDVMETGVTQRLMNAVNVALIRSIRRHVALRLKIDRDNGPQHGVVTSELVFYCQRLRQCGLEVQDGDVISMLWSDSSITPAISSTSPALTSASGTPSSTILNDIPPSKTIDSSSVSQ